MKFDKNEPLKPFSFIVFLLNFSLVFGIISDDDKDDDVDDELSANEMIKAATIMAQFSQNHLGKLIFQCFQKSVFLRK